MNPIAPHNPPIQGSPGQLPTNGGNGKKPDDTSFDDVLSGVPTKGLPSPIEDHSPPPNLDDPGTDSDDPTTPSLPRPMRWKGSKGPAADPSGTDPGTRLPMLPPQPDLRAIVPAVALSGDWARPVATPDHSEGTTIDTGASTRDTAAQISASGSPGNPGAMPPAPALSGNWARPIVTPDNSEGMATDVRSASQDTAQTSANGPSGSNASAGSYPVLSSRQTSMPILPSVGMVAGPSDRIPLPDMIAVAAGETVAMPNTVSVSIDDGQTVNPPAIGADAAKAAPAKERTALSPGQTTALPAQASDVTTGATASKANLADVTFLPANAMPTLPASNAPGATPGSVSAPVASATNAIPAGNSPTPATTATPGPGVEHSTPFKTDEAKIAASSVTNTLPVHDSKSSATQVPIIKPIRQPDTADGTPVAKDADVVNATLSSNEKETDSRPLPKRTGGVSAGTASSGRAGNGSTHGQESLAGVPVTATREIGATTSQITATPTPEPTAARQAVKVETLLQNALSAGESLRPNGQNHLEMRVRLGGGSEDVTVRMQVVNDRMQVTFQTDSPEMRKALEHGWQQFSTAAAHTSNLELPAPRFETNAASAASQDRGTDAQGYSFNQQNSRRQDGSAASFEDGISSADTRRSAASTATATSPATTGQATTRRWSGWA